MLVIVLALIKKGTVKHIKKITGSPSHKSTQYTLCGTDHLLWRVTSMIYKNITKKRQI